MLLSGEICLTGDRCLISSLATGFTGLAFWSHHPERANPMTHDSAVMGNHSRVQAEVSRRHSSWTTGVIRRRAEHRNKEEACSSPVEVSKSTDSTRATEPVPSFEP